MWFSSFFSWFGFVGFGVCGLGFKGGMLICKFCFFLKKKRDELIFGAREGDEGDVD